MSEPDSTPDAAPSKPLGDEPFLRVRRIHRRDLNRTWEFLKLVFREVNRETVEYQRPRSKKRFLEVYEEEGVEQLLFEVHEGHKQEIVGYAECAFEITGTDNWMNERYFAKHDMRPLFVEELAVHPGYQGRGIGSFLLEQLEHLARLRGCTHLVLEVAENNENALNFYKARSFFRLDAAIFLAKKVIVQDELLPPRRLKKNAPLSGEGGKEATRARKSEAPPKKSAAKKAAAASAKKAAASATAKKAAASTPAKKAGGKRTMVKAVSAPLAAVSESTETKG